jgi:hypothetical protein
MFVFITTAAVLLLLVILLVRWLVSRRKDIPSALFSAARKKENSGDYEEALSNYENALTEIRKIGHGKRLETIIIEKIKVLHTVIQYEKGFLI